MKHVKNILAVLCSIFLVLLVLAGIFAPVLAPNGPNDTNIYVKNAGPSPEYPLGNDYLGRCVLSRLIFGIRTTVFLSFLTTAGTMLIAFILAYGCAISNNGIFDRVLMRMCDGMQAFPSDLLVLVIVGAMGASKENIILAIILIRWAWYTRMLRASIRDMIDSRYIQYARIQNAGLLYIMRKHVFPVLLPEIFVFASMCIGSSITTISGFSFLGLGIQKPEAEWGAMLGEARKALLSKPLKILPSALAIIITVFCLFYISDYIQQALHKERTEV